MVSQPERIVSATAAISSSPTAGGWKPRNVVRLAATPASTVSKRMREAAAAALASASSRLAADREHRARAVGADPQRPEAVARPAVDAHPAHALDRLGLLERRARPASSPSGATRKRTQAPPDPRLGGAAARRASPSAADEREAVQVDAERGRAELRVVAAAQARGQLDHARPVRPDPDLRVGRPVRDPERLRPPRRASSTGSCARRPDVGERDAERRRLGGQAVGHGQRVELAADREAR